MEIRKLDQEIKNKSLIEDTERKNLKLVKLYSESVELDQYIDINSLDIIKGNIAGVNIPILKKIIFNDVIPNIPTTPLWIDHGIIVLKQLITLRVERKILQKQYELLIDELRTTTQRVNLFEKLKFQKLKKISELLEFLWVISKLQLLRD